jgi:hypothetical protein
VRLSVIPVLINTTHCVRVHKHILLTTPASAMHACKDMHATAHHNHWRCTPSVPFLMNPRHPNRTILHVSC